MVMTPRLSPNAQECLERYEKNVFNLIKNEDISDNQIAALSFISRENINRLRKGKGNILTLVRLLSALGYELAFVRTGKRIPFTEQTIDYILKYREKNLKQQKKYHAKRGKKRKPRKVSTRRDDDFLSEE